MSSAQLLLRRLLEQAGGAAESGYVLVIDGEGLEDLPTQMPTPSGSYGVHRVGTELGLRHLLWKAMGAPLIAVLPEEVAHRIQKAIVELERPDFGTAHPGFAVPGADFLGAVVQTKFGQVREVRAGNLFTAEQIELLAGRLRDRGAA